MGTADEALHQYPYAVLTSGSYHELNLWRRMTLALKELRTHDPDIVVLPGYWDPAFWALLVIAKLQRRKVVLSFDSTQLDHSRHFVLEQLKKMFVKQCDAGFAYGQRARRYLGQLGMPEASIMIRCQAAANDEIRSEFDIASRTRRQASAQLGLPKRNFCYVGRLSAEKNVLSLVQAFLALRTSNDQANDWGLCVVGDGPERSNIEEYCRNNGAENVVFIGGVSWRDVPKFLALSDVLVLPSTSEPWGLVVNEAMVCGLPVIVSNRCGCIEDLVIDGDTGFAFDPYVPSELLRSMSYFVNSPSEIQRIGSKGEELIRRFSPDAAARQMFTGIKLLLGVA